jgi:hypothetical protein
MDEVRHIVHLSLHRNLPITVARVLRNFRGRPRLVKVGAQKPPKLDDVENDERIYEENGDDNGDFFTPGESDIWVLHVAYVAQDETGYPTSKIPNQEEPPSARTTRRNPFDYLWSSFDDHFTLLGSVGKRGASALTFLSHSDAHSASLSS